MNKQILLLLAIVALASAQTTITSRLHKKADFTQQSLLGFYFPNNANTDKLLTSVNGVNIVGPFTTKDKVVYNHPELVVPRKSLDGTITIYGPSSLSEKDVKITISGTPVKILAVQQEGQGFLVTYQSTTYKNSQVNVEIQVNSPSWSFRGFIIKAQVCGVYCNDCSDNANICTSCAKNSTLVNGKCMCNAGFKATGIQPLSCEAIDENTIYPDLCYLEHVLYLINNEIRTRIVKEDGAYYLVGSLAGFQMPTSSCYSNNSGYMINIQTCFVHETDEDDCQTFSAQWQDDGLSYRIKMTDSQLVAASYFQTPKGAVQIFDKEEFVGTEYEFRVDTRFSSKFDFKLDCSYDSDDEMCTAQFIREHRFKLKITKFVDTKLPNLMFITENKQTQEDCGCPFNEFIKGTPYIYKEIQCQNQVSKPTYLIGTRFYVGVEMDDHTMIGNINIEKLGLECFKKDKKTPLYLSQSINNPTWEFSWKTCVTTQALKLDKDSVCQTCKSNLKVIISYYPEGKLQKGRFLALANESQAQDVQETTVEISMPMDWSNESEEEIIF